MRSLCRNGGIPNKSTYGLKEVKEGQPPELVLYVTPFADGQFIIVVHKQSESQFVQVLPLACGRWVRTSPNIEQ
jgi:hypothetical protein